MTERMIGGYDPAMTGYRKPNTRSSAPTRVRVYPVADNASMELVAKLRARKPVSGENLNRARSEDLMQNAYKTVPARTAQRSEAANVSEVSPRFNSNYSAYSSVNRAALEEAKKREAEARAARPANVRPANTRPANARPANARPASATAASARPSAVSAVGKAPASRPAAKPAPLKKAPVAAASMVKEVKFRTPGASEQLAESGPREVLFKRVPFPRFAVMILLIAVIFFLMVQSIMRNFEYKQEIGRLESQLSSLNDRAEELRLELEERDDLAELERLAEEIGMIKDASVDEKYISLENSDVIENFGGDKEDLGPVTTMLSAVNRQLSRFLGGE